MKKCTNCENTKFYAIELVRAWVTIDGNGGIIENEGNVEENRIENNNWECTNCGEKTNSNI